MQCNVPSNNAVTAIVPGRTRNCPFVRMAIPIQSLTALEHRIERLSRLSGSDSFLSDMDAFRDAFNLRAEGFHRPGREMRRQGSAGVFLASDVVIHQQALVFHDGVDGEL